MEKIDISEIQNTVESQLQGITTERIDRKVTTTQKGPAPEHITKHETEVVPKIYSDFQVEIATVLSEKVARELAYVCVMSDGRCLMECTFFYKTTAIHALESLFKMMHGDYNDE